MDYKRRKADKDGVMKSTFNTIMFPSDEEGGIIVL